MFGQFILLCTYILIDLFVIYLTPSPPNEEEEGEENKIKHKVKSPSNGTISSAQTHLISDNPKTRKQKNMENQFLHPLC